MKLTAIYRGGNCDYRMRKDFRIYRLRVWKLLFMQYG